jgi:signal transduction histidine kinase
MKDLRIPLWLELSLAILLALIISNAVTFALIETLRGNEIRSERMSALEGRMSTVAGLVLRLPESERAAVLKLASVRQERVSIGTRAKVAAGAARDGEAEARLKSALVGLAVGEVRVAKRGTTDLGSLTGGRRRGGLERLSVAISLGPKQWLNGEFVWPQGGSVLPALLLSVAVASVALIAVAVWLSYRISGPLQRLSAASGEMAQGRAVAPVPETGPRALRSAAQSFNAMSRRLMAVIDNQRTLLGSIAHDLRTPITALKIKSEFIADAELRERMNTSLDELQAMTEAALEAARTGMSEEAAREVDVAALVESVCADLADMGSEVSFADGAAVKSACRVNEIRRASRNLIENAVRYGTRARVSVHEEGGRIAITVDDDGPGLKSEEIARVFDPFVRLEGSRNRETGGLGLGLTLARAIARGHGGDIVLGNRDGGGLRATMTLMRS